MATQNTTMSTEDTARNTDTGGHLTLAKGNSQALIPSLTGDRSLPLSVRLFVMDARSAMRPCYILLMFFIYIFLCPP